MRITKVYTKTGDKGKTRLAGGQPVWKDHLRVEAYGTVDELNAAIGVVCAMADTRDSPSASDQQVEDDLHWVQNRLFDIGGLLATAPDQKLPNMPAITERDVVRLETIIDRCQQDLAPLREFILPGGGKVPAHLHQARTVCRRAERACVRLSRREPVDAAIMRFMNRLSDTLFVLARWVAKRHGEHELLWQREDAKRVR